MGSEQHDFARTQHPLTCIVKGTRHVTHVVCTTHWERSTQSNVTRTCFSQRSVRVTVWLTDVPPVVDHNYAAGSVLLS